jgi:hypothetical protein
MTVIADLWLFELAVASVDCCTMVSKLVTDAPDTPSETPPNDK